MKFAVLVKKSPNTFQAMNTAYFFVKASIRAGHKIHQVFFHHDAVYAANNLTAMLTNEKNWDYLWSQVATENNIDLVVCVSAAERRGVVDRELRDEHELSSYNCSPAFRLSGIGSLIDAVFSSDRLIEFG